MKRSSLLVRNPVLSLPSVARLRAMPREQRETLRSLLLDLRADAHARAEASWKRRKAPMATYWRCIAVYAGHIAKAIGRVA